MDPANEQLLISAQPFETRLAVVVEGRLQELHVTPTGGESAVGMIALGKVLRVLPGMQAAFVELGLARPGFLHASDIERPQVLGDGTAVAISDIRKLVHEGQVLPVQVAKDPIASKGARLTTGLALPSRYLVLTPESAHIGISQRITDDTERDRLRELVRDCAQAAGMPPQHGFIVRTVAQGCSADEFAADMHWLAALWREVAQRRTQAKTGDALFCDLPTHIRVLRDLVGANTASIQVDSADAFAAVEQFVARSLPDYASTVQHYKGKRGLFDHHGIEQQIRAALRPRVELPSGGYLIVEQTEAMITVDVNTGGFTGSSSLEDTVYKTNLEAALALPRELRLRNLGGLIVVDFIDMEEPEHRAAVLASLEAGCAGDPARIRVAGMSELGLVELSRKRTRESLARQFCEPCERCSGSGLVARPATVSFEVLRTLGRALTSTAVERELLVIAHDTVVARLLAEDAAHLQRVAADARLTVKLQAEPGYAPDAFELVHL